MAYFLAPIINNQLFDANGDPLSGGTVEVYLAGSSTPASTYTDSTGGTPNAWPIDLNTLGLNAQGEVWILGGQEYKFVIKDSAGVPLWDPDNISGINDTATAADQWVVYQAAPTYVSATSFTVVGDQTQTFAPFTRVRTSNTGGVVYGTVVRSTFTTSTLVEIVTDSGSLDAGLSLVSTGLLTAVNPSLPTSLNRAPFRNRIVNGAMRFDLVSQGAAQTITAAAAVRFGTEMFYTQSTGANVTAQRIAGTGYQYATRITGAASVTTTTWGTRLESSNTYDWANQQISVQIPISSSALSTVTWNAYYANVVDDWTNKTLIATGSLALTSTPTLKTFSFNAGANAINGVAIEFVTGPLLAAQTISYQGAYQAEAGPPTPFEVLDVGEDQRRVYRYVYTTYTVAPGTAGATANRRVALGTNAATPGLQFHLSMPVRMRDNPVVTLYNPTTGAIGSMRNETAGADLAATTFGSPGPDSVSAYNNAAAAAVGSIYGLHFFCAARLL